MDTDWRYETSRKIQNKELTKLDKKPAACFQDFHAMDTVIKRWGGKKAACLRKEKKWTERKPEGHSKGITLGKKKIPPSNCSRSMSDGSGKKKARPCAQVLPGPLKGGEGGGKEGGKEGGRGGGGGGGELKALCSYTYMYIATYIHRPLLSLSLFLCILSRHLRPAAAVKVTHSYKYPDRILQPDCSPVHNTAQTSGLERHNIDIN